MSMNTNGPKNWNPFRVLALLGLWLAALATLAFVASGCRVSPSPVTTASIALTSMSQHDHKRATRVGVRVRTVMLQLRHRPSNTIVATTGACACRPEAAEVPAEVYDVDVELRDSDGKMQPSC